MSTGTGVKPNKLWHWGVVIFLAATFLTEPRASMALTWELFRGAGAVGGEILTGEPAPTGTDPELQPEPATPPTPEVPPASGEDLELSEPEPGVPVITVGGDEIRQVLDLGVTGVLALHEEIEAFQANGGGVVYLGDRPMNLIDNQ